MITHDFLNSIPGRPSGFTWHHYDPKEKGWEPELRKDEGGDCYVEIIGGRLDLIDAPLNCPENLLEFATYIVAVEQAIAQLKGRQR